MFRLLQKGRADWVGGIGQLFCYLMGLDALDVAGEIKVELEFISALVLVLLPPCLLVAFSGRLFFLLFL